MESRLAAALVRSLFSGYVYPETRVAVFLSNSDESGVEVSGDHGRPFLVGGYVAPENCWPHFASAWQEHVLDRPPSIPYLHMTEIRRPDWMAKYRITLSQAERRIDKAVQVIRSTEEILAFTSMIRRDDLEEALRQPLRKAGCTRP